MRKYKTHKDDWWERTNANFKPIPANDARDLIDAYYTNPDKVVANGTTYEVLHRSEESFYFRAKGTQSVIRISTHWSWFTKQKVAFRDGYNRFLNLEFNFENDLICGPIASCWWTIKDDSERFNYKRIHWGGSYTLIGGKATRFYERTSEDRDKFWVKMYKIKDLFDKRYKRLAKQRERDIKELLQHTNEVQAKDLKVGDKLVRVYGPNTTPDIYHICEVERGRTVSLFNDKPSEAKIKVIVKPNQTWGFYYKVYDTLRVLRTDYSPKIGNYFSQLH